MFKKTTFFILTCACIIAIFLFSEQVAQTSDAVSRGIAEKILIGLTDYEDLPADQRLAAMASFNETVRSFAHFGIFLVLGIFSFGFFASAKMKRPVFAAVALCAGYAVFDEIHQEFFSEGRAFELIDLAKDWSGSALGILLAWIAWHFFAKAGQRQRTR
ncbi:Predicted integral membrane protein [uncultured Eubacterium sp.]|nr:Predicted integral membrane protein [uncultured Eubacterium sp.]